MKKIFFLASFLLFCFQFNIGYSQTEDHFRSKDNPYYWKNRSPYIGYWQQDIHYKIDAYIDETTDQVKGDETLTYWNNSPDTLPFVYFHLYQQAFVKGGHVENLNLDNLYKQTFGKYHSKGLGEIMESITVDGVELKQEKDFTVVKVYLVHPILPNSHIDFKIKFTTYWDNGSSQRSRFKKIDSYGQYQYDGVHWYPRICVYDRKFGWDTFQHLGKEFYGDFGTYEVSLNFASNFVVEATGILQNESEVMPKELRAKLDISNFIHKPWGSAPSVITPYNKDERKVWKYYAENVHDFAFTADPNYRIGETTCLPAANDGKGIKVIALVQEPKAAGWYNAAQYTAKIIEAHSKNFGTYCWPKIVVADAADGMEYPMLTLDGGYDPGYRGLFAHEVGHMWYFGQVGNNETYRAALDEGFTQFIQSYDQIQIDGPYDIKSRYKSKYYAHFKERTKVRYSQVYLGYLNDAMRDRDESINQHSDAFNGALNHGGGYGQVYYKTATMLWDMQYVLGDSLFSHAMKHYFNQWKFCHPYFEDFRNSIIQYTHVDLNWFFDEWMTTTKKVDYKVCYARKKGGKYEIKLKRLGRSEMPIDLAVVLEGNDTLRFYIPNTWFNKEIDTTKIFRLPKWYGWDKLHPTYTFTIGAVKKIKNVIIDPSHRLADVNLLNNSLRTPKKLKFDSQVYNTPDWEHYTLKWRPDVWYNAIDGVKAGLHLDGNYMNYRRIFSLTVWYNTGLAQQSIVNYGLPSSLKPSSPISFNFSYSTPIPKFIRNSDVYVKAKYLDGLVGGEFGIKTKVSEDNTLSIGFKTMYRRDATDALYTLYPGEWQPNEWNNTLRLKFIHDYKYFHGNGKIEFNAVSSTVYSSNNYSYVNLSCVNHSKLGKLDFNTRAFIQYGTGNTPGESSLYLAGGNMEEMMDDKYFRSAAFVPSQWTGFGAETNHFQYGGGLNLRGYTGYVVVQQKGGDLNSYYIYKGNSGASVNGELQFDRLIKFRPRITRNWLKMEPYFFGDAGVMEYQDAANKNQISDIRADAGIGAVVTITHFWVFEEVKPLSIRFDVPLVLNSAPYADGQYVKFRWLLSLDHAF